MANATLPLYRGILLRLRLCSNGIFMAKSNYTMTMMVMVMKQWEGNQNWNVLRIPIGEFVLMKADYDIVCIDVVLSIEGELLMCIKQCNALIIAKWMS